mmetsp:Transcript_54833/g.154336  ORF Transcript_54833/g.154336 Transcript_54833/m.154336 type:complete len:113 (+) Transcript_54833:67-405(+)
MAAYMPAKAPLNEASDLERDSDNADDSPAAPARQRRAPPEVAQPHRRQQRLITCAVAGFAAALLVVVFATLALSGGEPASSPADAASGPSQMLGLSAVARGAAQLRAARAPR